MPATLSIITIENAVSNLSNNDPAPAAPQNYGYLGNMIVSVATNVIRQIEQNNGAQLAHADRVRIFTKINNTIDTFFVAGLLHVIREIASRILFYSPALIDRAANQIPAEILSKIFLKFIR